MEGFKPLIAKVAAGSSLTRSESELAFDTILSGQVTPAQLGGFLMSLRTRGETIDEISGAVAAMRAKMLRVEAPENAIDVVGTGGDGAGSHNVSTLAALIVAACGVPVAKHGNRAASSKSGSSDILTALGVKIGITPEAVAHCLSAAGIGFMMAQTHHAAMRHVGPVRSELGTRTIFNLLGPLSNPAGVKRQLLGVYSSIWLEPLANVLKNLGSQRVWLVHGSDGLDEITTTGPTKVVALENGTIRSFQIAPSDVGLAVATSEDLKGGDPDFNAAALRAVVTGAKNAYRDIAVFNAAATLVVAQRAETLQEGVAYAQHALDNGKVSITLEKLILASNKD